MLVLKTAGESHGKAVIAYIEGLPAGIAVDIGFIRDELIRRRTGLGRGERSLIEEDKFEFLSGIYRGKTTGMPVVIAIYNTEYEKWKDFLEGKEDRDELKRRTPRPGHADYSGWVKYGYEDLRPVIERSSARHTAAYVAAGALFKQFLKNFNIAVYSFLKSVGSVELSVPEKITEEDLKNIKDSHLHILDKRDEERIRRAVEEAKMQGTTLGGSLVVVAFGIIPGLGSYSDYDKRMDYRLAGCISSIPSVKAVEIGQGIRSSKSPGRDVLDEFAIDNGFIVRRTNFSGGIEGGISNGQPVYMTVYFKPIPTQSSPLKSFDIHTISEADAFYERSDVFVGRAVSVIAESMVAYVVSEKMIDKFGGDTLDEIMHSYRNYIDRIRWRAQRELHL
jgi:chorismate synthase